MNSKITTTVSFPLPENDEEGYPTKLTQCMHQAAHAAMRHWTNLDTTGLEVAHDRHGDIDYVTCHPTGNPARQSDLVQIYAAGCAWEWHLLNDKELYEQYHENLYFADWYDELAIACRFIQDDIDFFYENSQFDDEYIKKMTIGLFRNTWKTLEDIYHPAMRIIALELEKENKVSGDRVKEIITQNLPDWWIHEEDEASA